MSEISKSKKFKLNKKTTRLILLIVFTIIIFIFFILMGCFIYKKFIQTSTITVSGFYEQKIDNEVATFYLYMEQSGEDKNLLLKQVEEATQQTIDSLLQLGIPKTDIKTQTVSVNKYRNWDPQLQDYIEGDWYANNSMEVVVEDKTKINSIIPLLSQIDLLRVDGPSITYKKTSVNQEELLQNAFLDAQNKAESLASESGLTLGKPLTIVEGYNSMPLYNVRAYSEGLASDAQGIPIEPGSSNTSKTITVVFEAY